jgi:hypothetical protein
MFCSGQKSATDLVFNEAAICVRAQNWDNGFRVMPVRRRNIVRQRDAVFVHGDTDLDAPDLLSAVDTPHDRCVRFVTVVTFRDATLTTRWALPLTSAGLSPAASRQLRLAHLQQSHFRPALLGSFHPLATV